MPPPERSTFTAAERRHAIDRLRRRIAELEAFDPTVVQSRRSPEIMKLEAAIDETLRAIFGNNTHRYRLYMSAADLEPAPVLNLTPSWIAARSTFAGDEFAGPRENFHGLRTLIAERKKRALALLGQAIQGLEEEFIADVEQPTERSLSKQPAADVARAQWGFMISDAEIRGRVLAILYNLRDSNGGIVPLSDINFSPDPVSPQKIGGVCQHLADVGLIQWNPTPTGIENFRCR